LKNTKGECFLIDRWKMSLHKMGSDNVVRVGNVATSKIFNSQVYIPISQYT